MKKNKNLEFLGFFERCDRLVTFWFRFQIIPVLIFYILFPFCFIKNQTGENYALYIWLGQVCLFLIIAIIGFFKAKVISKIFHKAVMLVSRHPNKDLIKIFSEVPRIIRTILVLEILLPIVWPFSFPLKFHFYKNINIIKSLIVEYKKLD